MNEPGDNQQEQSDSYFDVMEDIASACRVYYRYYDRTKKGFVRRKSVREELNEKEIRVLSSAFPESGDRAICGQFIDAGLEDVICGREDEEFSELGIADRDGTGRILGVVILLAAAGEKADSSIHGERPDEEHPSEEKITRHADKSQLDRTARFVQHAMNRLHEKRQESLNIREELQDVKKESILRRHLLERNETMTELLTLMESEDDFSDVVKQILEISCRHLSLSEGALLRWNPVQDTVEILAEYAGEDGTNGVADSLKGESKKDLPFFTGRPFTISSDSILPESFQEYFALCGFRAGVFYPVEAGRDARMYLQFGNQSDRRFEREELKFLNDVKKIVQTILSKRITRNSLTSSYVTLDSVLEKIGCGVAVIRMGDGTLLYSNQALKEILREDGDRDFLSRSASRHAAHSGEHYEFRTKDGKRWYEITLSSVKWVDGSLASLMTAYDITRRKEYQARIEHQIYVDEMTGLKNRRAAEEDVDRVLTDSNGKNGTLGAVVYIDLDDFKNINDSLGHETGDILLQKAAEALVRAGGTDAEVYRLGGDEFGLLIPADRTRTPDEVAKRVLESFRKPWDLKDKEYYCTCSIGIAFYPRDGRDMETLFRHADIALHQAKHDGKNRIVYYISDDPNALTKRLDMERAMRKAVSEGCKEFTVYYQPLVDASKPDHPCCGAEALVRWNSKTLGFVLPMDFVPLAEYLGLIVPIGRHVLFEACAQCRHWNDFGHPEYKVNVNLSLVQLMQKDIVETIKDALDSTGLNPHNLTLEVTEGLAIHDMKAVSDLLNRMKKLGVRIALDDFGTGYSSLSCLKELPLDVIKIDKCFVDNVGEDRYSDAFVNSVTELADVMDADVVVEGVENDRQRVTLEDMNVDIIQGYLYDKPLPEEEFEKKYVGE